MRKTKYKTGDRVRVVRKAESHKNGWNNSWNREMMDVCVGKVFSILYNCGANGYRLKTKTVTNGDYSFPEFVLEPEIKIGEQLLFSFMEE